MSNFFDDLEAQLHAAAQAPAEPFRAGLRVLPIVATAAVPIAVAILAIALIGHGSGGGGGGQPPLGVPPGANQRQELGYIRAATATALRTAACRRHAPTITLISHDTPPRALLSLLGVLRRPATPADRLPRSELENATGARGIYVDYIRLARVQNAVSYYIVPAARVNSPLVRQPGCWAAMRAALRAELPHIPAALRQPTLSLQTRLITADSSFGGQADTGGVCLVFVARDGTGGSCGVTAQQIARQGMLSSFGTLSGIVPDGVAKVTVFVPSGSGLGTDVVTSDVVGNVFVGARTAVPRGRQRPTMVWRSARGRVIKRVLVDRSTGGPSSSVCSGRPGSHVC